MGLLPRLILYYAGNAPKLLIKYFIHELSSKHNIHIYISFGLSYHIYLSIIYILIEIVEFSS